MWERAYSHSFTRVAAFTSVVGGRCYLCIACIALMTSFYFIFHLFPRAIGLLLWSILCQGCYGSKEMAKCTGNSYFVVMAHRTVTINQLIQFQRYSDRDFPNLVSQIQGLSVDVIVKQSSESTAKHELASMAA